MSEQVNYFCEYCKEGQTLGDCKDCGKRCCTECGDFKDCRHCGKSFWVTHKCEDCSEKYDCCKGCQFNPKFSCEYCGIYETIGTCTCGAKCCLECGLSKECKNCGDKFWASHKCEDCIEKMDFCEDCSHEFA